MDLAALRQHGIAFSTDPLDRHAARRDLWPRHTLAMRGGTLPPTPAVVTWPKDIDDALLIIERAHRDGVAVVPYGAGSGVCGGAAGLRDSVVIDTKRMQRLLRVDPETRTVTVQTGMLGQHLEDALGALGWMTAHSPSSIMCSTVGGYVAARSAGQFSSRYGVFDDMLLAARAVTPSGVVQGGMWTRGRDEDLLPVLAGSEGTLGVITDALLRIVPLPQTRWFRGYRFSTLEAAWEAMRQVMQAELWPSVLRLYGPVDSRIGGPARGARDEQRHSSAGGDVLRKLRTAVERTPGLRRHLLDLPLALPGLVNSLAQGISQGVVMVLGFEGPPDVVQAAVRAAAPLVQRGQDLGAAPGEHWYAHRHDVSYKLAPIFAAGGFADTMEVAAPWSRLAKLYRKVNAALSRHAVVMAHFSHAYPEGCSIYFSFAGAGRLAVYDAAWAAGLDAVRQAGGTVTHHHGVGQLKAQAAAQELGAALRVWTEIKDQLDPRGIMNPGRLFPHDPPEPAGPPRPVGRPVFAVDRTSGLAEVDPFAEPAELEHELFRRGLVLSTRPDRPLAQWLPRLRRGVLRQWDTPLFAVQARFADGVSARIGDAPRSAAGPDLRWSLLRRAQPEMVQVPVRPLHGHAAPYQILRPGPQAPSAEDLRPAWQDGDRWGFSMPGAQALADLCEGRPARGKAPRVHPTAAAFKAPPPLPEER